MKRIIIIFLVVLFNCNSNIELPILSYKIDSNGVRQDYTISYTDFTNQLGEVFTTDTIKGKVLIANFFFTKCPSICPPMRTQLIDIAETFNNSEDFLIISHTIDPKDDTISILKDYAESTEVSHSKWQFLRASIEQTKGQAKQFMTHFKPNEDGTDFYHSSYVSLIDKKQRIRGFYNILIPEDVIRLKKDIKILLN